MKIKDSFSLREVVPMAAEERMEKAVSLEQDLVEQKRLGMTTNAEAAK
jgi:hypothetical protein